MNVLQQIDNALFAFVNSAFYKQQLKTGDGKMLVLLPVEMNDSYYQEITSLNINNARNNLHRSKREYRGASVSFADWRDEKEIRVFYSPDKL